MTDSAPWTRRLSTACDTREHSPAPIRPLIVEGIEDSRIVFVAGARQVGKTTLVGDIAAHERPMTSFTLDDRATREAAIADPAGFVGRPRRARRSSTRSTALPTCCSSSRRPSTPTRRLGASSSPAPPTCWRHDGSRMRFQVESIASTCGRSLRARSAAGRSTSSTSCSRRAPRVSPGAPAGRAAFAQIVAEGGYPEARVRPPGAVRERWFANYVAGDARARSAELADVRRIDDAERLLRLLATQSANLLSYRKVGLAAGHASRRRSRRTSRCSSRCSSSSGFRLGGPGSVRARPRHRSCTSATAGCSRSLLGADADRIARRRPGHGQAMRDVRRRRAASGTHRGRSSSRACTTTSAIARTSTSILENNRGEVVGVEVKAAATLRASDWKWLKKLADDARRELQGRASSSTQASRPSRSARACGPCRTAGSGREQSRSRPSQIPKPPGRNSETVRIARTKAPTDCRGHPRRPIGVTRRL